MKHITRYQVLGRIFEIVENESGWFLAIDNKYITDGKLNCTLNGLQMHAGRTVTQCMENARISVLVEDLSSKGYLTEDIMEIVFRR